MALPTLHTTKKTFYYSFFPTKADEDTQNPRKAHDGGAATGRKLIEIRDIHPPPVVDSDKPWVINKTLNQYEVAFGKLVVSCCVTFEHVIRYWTQEMANYLAIGQRVGVVLWDVTEEKKPKKYQSNDVYLQMMVNDDCVLSCMELIKCRKLKCDDKINLYWDSKESCFNFRLVSW